MVEINGNDHIELKTAFKRAAENAEKPGHKPTVIIANTLKGCGVSFMENDCNWHGNAPNAEQLRQALSELGLEGEQ